MKDIVLIHGTWCDGNVWGELMMNVFLMQKKL